MDNEDYTVDPETEVPAPPVEETEEVEVDNPVEDVEDEEEEINEPEEEEEPEVVDTSTPDETEKVNPLIAYYDLLKENGYIKVEDDFEFDGSSESFEEVLNESLDRTKGEALQNGLKLYLVTFKKLLDMQLLEEHPLRIT